MATGLPNSIYNGGAVVFNSQPYTNYYLNSLAKKRAKDEALDNYFNNFNKSINPAGMRTQDIEGGWMNKVNDWQGYYQQNKNLIENPKLDNGKAYNEYLARYQDLNADIQKSKNLADVSKQYVVPLQTNPDKSQRVTPNSINAIHAHDLSMYDQNHKALDPSQLEFDYKPFGIADQQKLDNVAFKDVKMSGRVAKNVIDPKTKTRTTTYESSFTPDDLKTIAGRYVSAYNQHGSFQNAIHDLAHDPNTYDQYNDVFKNVYGRDIHTDEDMAAAYGLSRVQQKQQTQKTTGYNPYSPYDYESAREKYHDFAQADVNDSIDQNVDRQISQAQQDLENQPKNSIYGKPVYVSIDPATLKALNIDNMQYVGGDKPLVPIWHDTINKGTPNEKVVERQGTPITVDDYKMATGKRNVGAKYFEKKSTQQPSQKSSSSTTSKKYSVNGKSYTDNDLKKLGYTDDQIQQAIKLGTLKVQ